MIGRSPAIMHFASDLHIDYVEAPSLTAKATHRVFSLATDVASEPRAEPVPPHPHDTVDVSTRFGQHLQFRQV